MKKAAPSDQEVFHPFFVTFFFLWMILHPFYRFLHFLLFYFTEGRFYFWDLSAIVSAYSAYLILRERRIGVYLLLLCTTLKSLISLSRFSLGPMAYFHMLAAIIILIVLFFVLKKDGRNAWSVLK